MLVVERRESQSVIITMPDGRTITVCVVKIKGRDKVKLGFTAPSDISLCRDDAINREPR